MSTSNTAPTPLPPEELRWRLDPDSLGFATTDDLEPLDQIIGQERGVEAFRFGMGIRKKGYNIFVTGEPGTGRMSTVKKLLGELTKQGPVPDDLCYVYNFKYPEAPVLLRFEAGRGQAFREAMRDFVESVRRDAPQLFESEEYIARKNEIMEAHEKRVREFYKSVDEKVKDSGLALVKVQMGDIEKPEVVPVVDGEPKRIVDLEEMVEKGRFPREEFEKLKEKREEVREEVNHIFLKVRDLQKDVARKMEEVDKHMFRAMAEEYIAPIREEFGGEKIDRYCEQVVDDMVENINTIKMLIMQQQGGGQQQQMMPFMISPEAAFHNYEVNLLVDNAEQQGPPVIVESYPTYRNLFGSIERAMDRMGGWRTDFTKVKAGSFVKAGGGYLVINLMDAIVEPGVWQTLKRSLKTEEIEIETYDPYYFMTSVGLKPEPIDMRTKVVVLGDPYLFSLLKAYDPDMGKIFKVRADYNQVMDRDEESIQQVARFVKNVAEEDELLPFAASGVGVLVEESVRIAGRREKLSTTFANLSDLLIEADLFARRAEAEAVEAEHVKDAIEARIYRANRVEERIQEMIERGSIFVDVEGAEAGQINGLAVYSMGDYMFGKPSRITASVAMGKEGIINIEREAELSGPTHNKGMLILAGYLRRNFAQKKPLSLAASIAFEQSYGGVDGDSASSTELYALFSALSGVPIRQDIAVTGSVNQKGEIQPIGGVNQKVEGFYLTCKNMGLTGEQGVMIPKANVQDMMLRDEIVQAVEEGTFRIYAVETIDQGVEILMGMAAGTRDEKGDYPEGTLFAKVDARLTELAEGLREFAEAAKEEVAGKKED
jgi:lon-related putative ATP-dependent protease